MIDTEWYTGSVKGRLVLDGAGSVEGGTGWYSVVLGQNRAVLVASVMLSENIWSKSSNY